MIPVWEAAAQTGDASCPSGGVHSRRCWSLNKKMQKIVVGVLAAALILSILVPALSMILGG